MSFSWKLFCRGEISPGTNCGRYEKCEISRELTRDDICSPHATSACHPHHPHIVRMSSPSNSIAPHKAHCLPYYVFSLIADDMGLGKTLTMISLVATKMKRDVRKKKKMKKVASISSDSDSDEKCVSDEDEESDRKEEDDEEGWLGKGKCRLRMEFILIGIFIITKTQPFNLKSVYP